MMAPIIGTADHYAAFVKLCRARIEQLNITMETVDELAGFPARYTAILLSGGKAMSVYSLFTMARVLALSPMFHHDADQHELLMAREGWQKATRGGAKYRGNHHGKHRDGKHGLGADYWHNLSLVGNLSRSRKLSPRKRSSIARGAANMRWHRGGQDGKGNQ